MSGGVAIFSLRHDDSPPISPIVYAGLDLLSRVVVGQFDTEEGVLLQLEYEVKGMDFRNAGKASTRVRKRLQQLGLDSTTLRSVAVICYEAEMNIVIHAYEGRLIVDIDTTMIEITARDRGPGIEDIERAMQDGFSTAPEHVREMGFGAGMVLTNIKRLANSLQLESTEGEGTCLKAVVYYGYPQKGGVQSCQGSFTP